MTDRNEIDRIAENLVRNEVLCNVSHLVGQLAQRDEYCDELAEVMAKDDWRSAVEEYVQNEASPETLAEFLETEEQVEDAEDAIAHRTPAELVVMTMHYLQRNMSECDEQADWRSVAEEFGIDDPQIDEALEHWVISDSLATNLEAQGEIVLRDFHGLTIWGRTCSGQAITCDGCIRTVARSLVQL